MAVLVGLGIVPACGGGEAITVDAGVDARAPDAAQPADARAPDALTATTYNVTLTKAQVVGGPCPGAGPNATGTAMVTVSADETMLIVSNVTYSGLAGPATAANIRCGAAGANAALVLNFGTSIASPFSKTFTMTDYAAAVGCPSTWPAFITSLKAGQAYINIHTFACMAGEIRGQIQ